VSHVRITITLPVDLYQEVRRQKNRSAFIQQALIEYCTRHRTCDLGGQIADYCKREEQADRAMCSDLDGCVGDGLSS
jgi:metal-responsive CopG/Arc/MetJ family transcriptional regulator